jgi:beta-N-acetylhexosaminidase
MIGHIKYPKIDKNPATLSSIIISQKLVNDLQYKGLVVSDDMEMKALSDIDSYTHLAKRALLAGNDLLIYSTPSDSEISIQKQVYDYILQEVKNENMNIDQKVLKILKMKIKYGIIPS